MISAKNLQEAQPWYRSDDSGRKERKSIAHVSPKADNDTPMEEITAIKKVLREYYIYQLNMEVNKTIDNGEGTLYQQRTITQKQE